MIKKVQGITISSQEKDILTITVELWSEYLKLPVQHPDDIDEMRHAIHNIQRMIFSRPAERMERGIELKYRIKHNKQLIK